MAFAKLLHQFSLLEQSIYRGLQNWKVAPIIFLAPIIAFLKCTYFNFFNKITGIFACNLQDMFMKIWANLKNQFLNFLIPICIFRACTSYIINNAKLVVKPAVHNMQEDLDTGIIFL